MSARETAIAACEAGLAVFPPKEDGTKAPMGRWKGYQKRRPSLADVEKWYSRPRHGVGLITGEVSGGLEMFEFEGRAMDEGLLDRFRALAEQVGIGDLIAKIENGYSECTPSGGVHWLYRCPDIEGNLKLASRAATADELEQNPDERVKVLIETRGEGGYVVIAPSSGPVHKSKRSWELTSGGFETITTITPEERAQLHGLARSFDQRPAMAGDVAAAGASLLGKGRPGDVFNALPDIQDQILTLLEENGWTRVSEHSGVVGLCRPGKEPKGLSATVGYLGPGWLYVFSTSTEFEAPNGYSPFTVYTMIKHGGDFKAAARGLAEELGLGPLADRADDPEVRRTDRGNATRLIAVYGGKLKYVPEWGKWLTWDGTRWERDRDAQIIEHAKTVSDDIRRDAAVTDDEDEAEKLFKWAHQSENAGRIESMVKLARSVPGVPVGAGALDADPLLLNTMSGVVDLRTRQLLVHDPALLMTKRAAVAYDPQAICPRFDQFLERVLPNPELRGFLQRCVGYSLTGLTTEQVLFILYGNGANGKTTLLNAILNALGPYGGMAAPGLLLSGGYSHPTGVADLQGQRMVVSTEIEQGRLLNESLVKQLTGSDRLKARHLYQDFFEFTPTHKLWMGLNELPEVSGTDEGIWRRMLVIPFDVEIPAGERDRDLPASLAGEASGILNWAINGSAAWISKGLKPPAVVNEVTAEFRREMNPVQLFIDDRCILGPALSEEGTKLYNAYLEWSDRTGNPRMTQKRFGTTLAQLGFVKRKTPRSIWFGVALIA